VLFCILIFFAEIWNATRFALKKLEGDFTPAEHEAHHPKVSRIDQWILSRLAEFVENINGGFQQLNFSKATTACYNFWMYDLCDNYLVLNSNLCTLIL
jgi:valyl-tRNA synthetase